MKRKGWTKRGDRRERERGERRGGGGSRRVPLPEKVEAFFLLSQALFLELFYLKDEIFYVIDCFCILLLKFLESFLQFLNVASFFFFKLFFQFFRFHLLYQLCTSLYNALLYMSSNSCILFCISLKLHCIFCPSFCYNILAVLDFFLLVLENRLPFFLYFFLLHFFLKYFCIFMQCFIKHYLKHLVVFVHVLEFALQLLLLLEKLLIFFLFQLKFQLKLVILYLSFSETMLYVHTSSFKLVPSHRTLVLIEHTFSCFLSSGL